MSNWYLVAVKPSEQDRAEDNLGSQMFEVFNPKLNDEMDPLFPGYVFVKFDPMVQSASKINNSRGVRKLVTFGNEIVPVPEKAILVLRGFQPPAPQPIERKELNKGEMVEINTGPFAGVKAIFDEPNGEKRSFLIIEMLGNQQRIAVSNTHFA